MRKSKVRVSQYSMLTLWTVIIAGMFFAAGRASTPYCAINDLPDGTYTSNCFERTQDGRLLTIVKNERGDVVRLIAYSKPLPAKFDVETSLMDQGKFKHHGYSMWDTTAEKPKLFWWNLRDRT